MPRHAQLSGIERKPEKQMAFLFFPGIPDDGSCSIIPHVIGGQPRIEKNHLQLPIGKHARLAVGSYRTVGMKSNDVALAVGSLGQRNTLHLRGGAKRDGV